MNPHMIICTFVFSTAWINLHGHACQEDLPQELVLDWFKKRILERLQLEKPPVLTQQNLSNQRVHVVAQHKARRVRRETWLERRQYQEISQVILFPSSGESILNCNRLLFKIKKHNEPPRSAIKQDNFRDTVHRKLEPDL